MGQFKIWRATEEDWAPHTQMRYYALHNESNIHGYYEGDTPEDVIESLVESGVADRSQPYLIRQIPFVGPTRREYYFPNYGSILRKRCESSFNLPPSRELEF